MALTAYCKKCAREVDAGEICPVCGTRLGKNAAHAAWCVERIPVKDWMCWNALMRILLPAALVILVLVLAAEAVSGGAGAVERLLVSGFPTVLLILLGSILVLAFIALLLQGKELTDYVVDNRGIHEIHYLRLYGYVQRRYTFVGDYQLRVHCQGRWLFFLLIA